jgi:TatD DNase family protein
MWIDTHCHLDATEFGDESGAVASAAGEQGVSTIVIPAVARQNFAGVAALAAANANCVYALGIHPIHVPQAEPADLLQLRSAVAAAIDDPRFIGIGEIGLDFFIPALTKSPLREKQEHFYAEQLKLARDFDLPVLLHVRRAQDMILKHLRRVGVRGGCAHAFNGSFQQADTFIKLGFKLGFGGAMTFPRALQIRRLATELPLESIVLETDAPDISPAWLYPACNTPAQIPRIGAVLAELRQLSSAQIASTTTANALHALPRISAAT